MPRVRCTLTCTVRGSAVRAHNPCCFATVRNDGTLSGNVNDYMHVKDKEQLRSAVHTAPHTQAHGTLSTRTSCRTCTT